MESYLENPIPSIQQAKHGRYHPKLRFTHHALAIRMIERNISRQDVEAALNSDGIMILRNNGDNSPSCRVQGWDESGRPLQVVVAYKAMLVVTIITAGDADYIVAEDLVND